MDRRTALKKLAAGGAIAAGGSLVLSSNAIAQTCSQPIVPPPPAAAFTRQLVSNQMRLTPTAAMSADVMPTYAWRIESYANFQNLRGLRIRPSTGGSNDVITQSTSSNNCAAPCQPAGVFATGPGDATICRFWVTGRPNPVRPLRPRPNATYVVDVQVTWNQPGCPPVTAVYRFTGAGRALPTVTTA